MDPKKLQKARKEAGLTQSELAKILGVKQATVSKYESGEIDVTIAQLEQLADALNISLFSLLPEATEEEKREFERLQNVRLDKMFDTALEEGIIHYFRSLNPEGQCQLIEYAQYLCTLDKYKKG